MPLIEYAKLSRKQKDEFLQLFLEVAKRDMTSEIIEIYNPDLLLSTKFAGMSTPIFIIRRRNVFVRILKKLKRGFTTVVESLTRK